MHQLEKIGGGISEDSKYETWEIKACPSCNRIVKEFYSVEVMTLDKVKKIVQDEARVILAKEEGKK